MDTEVDVDDVVEANVELTFAKDSFLLWTLPSKCSLYVCQLKKIIPNFSKYIYGQFISSAVMYKLNIKTRSTN